MRLFTLQAALSLMQNHNASTPTLLWHDYESWGADPQKDHPCQFAAIRTDLDLNPIGDPINWMCQIPNDYLPHPEACLITGITPQQSIRDGMLEAEFMKKIHAEMSQPQTCTLGYNNLRFDDELTRFSLYRNFFNPYAREWQNGNSRWDIIDMVRACYALRPEGIEWVYNEDDVPVFKLELLSKANGIEHEAAHDALSDVYATIGIAKLIKQKQPRLYNYLFELRSKQKVAQHISYAARHPLVHISSKIPAINGCCTWIVPICPHPTNKNAVICINLALDVQPLLDLSPEEIREKLYKKTTEFEPGETRLPLKLIHLNKSPVIAPAKTLTEENAERLGIDRDKCLSNFKLIQATMGLEQKLSAVYEDEQKQQRDADHALYTGGFLSNRDQELCALVQDSAVESLDQFKGKFEDPRMETLLFRYRGRNYPQFFDAQELTRWQAHRNYRITDPESPGSIHLQDFMVRLEELSLANEKNPKKLSILKDLYHYAQQL